MNIPKNPLLRAACLVAACGFVISRALATDGYFVQGFGAVNSSLGGAATAGNEQDLIGSLYKNPANGILFADRMASISFGDIVPKVTTTSSVAAVGMSGSSDSTVNGVPYLSFMATWKAGSPGLTWFAGAVSEAGLSFHAASSTTNPIFFMQAGSAGNPFFGHFGGFGDVRSSLYVVRLPIGVAGTAPDRWSWGVELAPSIGRNLFSPAAFAAPGLSSTGAVYPLVQQQDMQLGLGVQGGMRCQVDKDLSIGFSLCTPTWFHTYSWTVTDPSGATRTVTFRMDRPMTAQIGMNYSAADNVRIVADVGYIAYGSTPGFEHSGFKPTGAIAGLGWKDSYTLELGVQYAVTPGVTLRAGYNYCSDPVPASMTFYNVGSPLYIESHLSAGASILLSPGTTLDLSFTHGFSKGQSSTWYTMAGPVPGSNITSTISGNEFAIGTTFKF